MILILEQVNKNDLLYGKGFEQQPSGLVIFCIHSHEPFAAEVAAFHAGASTVNSQLFRTLFSNDDFYELSMAHVF